MGRVISALNVLPGEAAANTLIVFTADHGFSLGDQGGWGKRTLWETDARVPLMVVPPALRAEAEEVPRGDRAVHTPLLVPQRGVRSRALIELVDLFPTLIELAGLHDDPLPQATAAAAGRDGAVRRNLSRRRPDDSAAALSEPPLDGVSFAHLLYRHGSSSDSSSSILAQQRRATSQFPRCPVKVSRAGSNNQQRSRISFHFFFTFLSSSNSIRVAEVLVERTLAVFRRWRFRMPGAEQRLEPQP